METNATVGSSAPRPAAPGGSSRPAPEAALPRLAPGPDLAPNPRLRIDPALGLVVIEFLNGENSRASFPTPREMAAYHRAARSGEDAAASRPGAPRGSDPTGRPAPATEA